MGLNVMGFSARLVGRVSRKVKADGFSAAPQRPVRTKRSALHWMIAHSAQYQRQAICYLEEAKSQTIHYRLFQLRFIG